MPRDGQSNYALPAGTLAQPDTIIESAKFNAFALDIQQDLNTDRPVAAGGTGASTPEAARANLELVKQASVLDATAGRLMLTGAGGLLGTGPEVTAENALDNVAVTQINYVAAANVATVGGPSGAGDGVCVTLAAGARRYQAYYPLNSQVNLFPWRRRYSGSYSTWRRDYDTGSNANGTWRRWGSGAQECEISGVSFEFFSDSGLRFAWTFPIDFIGSPQITLSLSNSGGNYTGGVTRSMLGAFSHSSGLTAANCDIARVAGAGSFAGNAVVAGAKLLAVGRWG